MPIKEVQLTNKQHAVPQNIMDVEFKLIGDLTMRQFAYLVVFGGLAWVSFSLVKGAFRLPFTVFFAIFGLALAFFTIGDRGMDQWVVNFFRSMYSPTQKVWKKDPIVPSIFLHQNLAVVRQEIITLAPTSSRRKLEEYLEYQGKTTTSDKLDIPEMDYVRMVRDAYSSYGQTAPTITEAPVIETPIVDSDSQPLGTSTPMPSDSSSQQPQNQQQSVTPQSPESNQAQPASTGQKSDKQTQVETKLSIQKRPDEQKHQKPQKPHGGLPKFDMPSRKETYIPLSPLTPDMHSGRVFTNLLPEQSEIILPVRGEKILKTSEEQDIEQDINQKADQLRKLIEQIKKDENYKGIIQSKEQKPAPQNEPYVKELAATVGAVPPVAKVKDISANSQPAATSANVEPEVKEVKEAGDILESLRAENSFLNKQIEQMRADIEKSRQQGIDENQKLTELERLQKEKAQVTGEVQTLQSTISDIKEKIQQKQLITTPTYAKIQPLTDRANIISGVVKNVNTNTALEGIVLIIKNQSGETVRALKTNSLGQFSISTPLSNGKYTIEIDSSNKTGLTFDIISVELKGVVLPPMEFLGR